TRVDCSADGSGGGARLRPRRRRRARPRAPLVAAREPVLGSPIDDGVVYVGEHCHRSVSKAARIAGVQAGGLRTIPSRDIDVLVNDIWGAERLKGGPADWNTPIWEHDLEIGRAHV